MVKMHTGAGCAANLLAAVLALCAWACGDDPGEGQPPSVSFRVVTFNTGSAGPTGRVSGQEYTDELKGIGDEWYGNGLAWLPAVEATRRWLEQVAPEVIVFQEVFSTEDCSDIPVVEREGFVCAGHSPGDDTVAQLVLGEGYQLMCQLQHNDKCAAVRLDFGSFAGCEADYCPEGLAGAEVDGCGHGSRVGRGTIDLVVGETLTLVSFHGSSGVTSEDMECRRRQVDQVFVDLGTGDGQPAANGERNLIMGDLNTDPVRWASFDASAARWLDFVANPDAPASSWDRPFHFVSDVGEEAEPTYAALFNIDHVVSDRATGSCWVAGITSGHPYVLGADVYFDHHPIVCDLEMALPGDP